MIEEPPIKKHILFDNDIICFAPLLALIAFTAYFFDIGDADYYSMSEMGRIYTALNLLYYCLITLAVWLNVSRLYIRLNFNNLLSKISRYLGILSIWLTYGSMQYETSFAYNFHLVMGFVTISLFIIPAVAALIHMKKPLHLITAAVYVIASSFVLYQILKINYTTARLEAAGLEIYFCMLAVVNNTRAYSVRPI